MVTQEEIIRQFRKIAQNNQYIRLLNIYKGLPINNEATIVKIESTYIEVETDRYQTVCLFLDRETFIQSHHLDQTIKARIYKVDPQHTRAILYGFESIPSGIGDRTQVRVEPDEPILGVVQVKDAMSTIQGNLADISQNGVGFFIDRNSFSPRHLRIGSEITISFKLPEGNFSEKKNSATLDSGSDPMARFSREQIRVSQVVQNRDDNRPKTTSSLKITPFNLQIRGQIVNVRPSLSANLYRIGVRLFNDEQSKIILSNFISLRQSEIIRELKTRYDAITKFNQQDQPSP